MPVPLGPISLLTTYQLATLEPIRPCAHGLAIAMHLITMCDDHPPLRARACRARAGRVVAA